MRYRKVFCIWGVLCFLIISGAAAAETAGPLPKARVAQDRFAFSPVVAGTAVEHRFSIFNTGEAPLNIIDVHTG
jgi:hypothetical protein